MTIPFPLLFPPPVLPGMNSNSSNAQSEQDKLNNDWYATQKSREDEEDEKAAQSDTACATCDKNNKGRCDKLKSKMDNQAKTINEDYDNIVENPCDLPMNHENTDWKWSISGHWSKMQQYTEDLRENTWEYTRRKCGPIDPKWQEALDKPLPWPKGDYKSFASGPNKCFG